MRRSIARPKVDLPHPDSPTSPSVSLSRISSETPSTALTTRLTVFVPINLSSGPPPPRSKCTLRSLMDINGDPFVLIRRLVSLRIHCKPHAQSDRANNDPR